ncbi:hypothetical protein KKF38_03540 [Patescibacteria group bacterium]|nr:hypothetical protein [Patescibacteria group bacterium]
MNDEIKNHVDYRILIKHKNNYFGLGKVSINTHKGDFYYFLPRNSMLCGEKLDHISFHKDGNIHAKLQSGKRVNLVKRQPTQNIGFQYILGEAIKDFQKLPIISQEKIDAEKVKPIVFRAKGTKKPIILELSIVSGKNIISFLRGEETPLSEADSRKNPNILGAEKRCLGWHSGNADKLMQYCLLKFPSNWDFPTNIRLQIPQCSKIKNK